MGRRAAKCQYTSPVSASSPSPTSSKVATRDDIRNIAIVAHVDHGKTTLVDAMLHQTGSFGSHENVAERAMDSMDQEKERGITILAKNTAVNYNGMVINVVDTPGHADFSGEVERGLAMVDGVALLVDAAEGPLPQTRFVLRKALERNMPIVLVVNKVDRHDARPAEVVDEVLDLLIDLGASDEQALDIPTIYAIGRDGKAGAAPDALADDLTPLFDMLLEEIPAPTYDPEAPLQALVTNLDASPYLGRIALLRIVNGEIKKGQQVAWIHEGIEDEDGVAETVISRAKIVELLITQAMTRVPGESARAGDIIAIAGIEDITIGDTIGDIEDARVLPRLTVDEPAIGMQFSINDSPLAGQSGSKVTARMLKERIDKELIGNVSIRLVDLGVPDRWEIQGRGEMQLAVLIESMRREGYELTVGKPRVITHEIDGKVHEPIELAVVDMPEEFVGAVTQLMGTRKGRMVDMQAFGAGWTRVSFHVPARGLIGFRTTFLSATQGTGQLHATFHSWEPWMGELRLRQSGSLVADRSGPATAHAIGKLEDRGTLFVEPTDDVYEGRIVGEHIRPEDLDVNIVREKHLTNHRSATGDELVRMNRARKMSLDEALEFVREDECVEVTPDAIRLRKSILKAGERHTARSKAKHGG